MQLCCTFQIHTHTFGSMSVVNVRYKLKDLLIQISALVEVSNMKKLQDACNVLSMVRSITLNLFGTLTDPLIQ